MSKVIQKRIVLLMFVLLPVFSVLIFRLVCIQILFHEYYKTQAVRHLDRYHDFSPRRGNISDRNGVVLAKTEIIYQVRYQLYHFRDENGKVVIRESMRNLSKLLDIPVTKIVQVCQEKNAEVERRILRALQKHRLCFYLSPKLAGFLDQGQIPPSFYRESDYNQVALPPSLILQTVKKGEEWLLLDSQQQQRFLIVRQGQPKEKTTSTDTKQKPVKVLAVYQVATARAARKLRRAKEADLLRRQYLLLKEIDKKKALLLQSSKSQWQTYPHKLLAELPMRFSQQLDQQVIPDVLPESFPDRFTSKARLTVVQPGKEWQIDDPRSKEQLRLLKKDHKIALYQQEHVRMVDEYEGFTVWDEVSREYPLEDTAAHILGRMGKIYREEYEQKGKDYRLNDYIGRAGLEKIYEDELRGSRGALIGVRKGGGKSFSDPPTDGKNLVLTLDANLQRIAETALDKAVDSREDVLGGAAVFMDVESGEILVLATSPRYDNNAFSELYPQLKSNPKRPLENRAIYNSFPPPPGSIFKIISAIAQLEENIHLQEQVYCRGYLHRPGAFGCTHRHYHIGLVDSITESCNIYFYQLGELLGEPLLTKWGRRFGFGEKTGIILPREYSGFLPTKEWKEKRGQTWYKADSRFLAIGQLVNATPLQVARAMATVATRGKMPEVSLIKGLKAPASLHHHKLAFSLNDFSDISSFITRFSLSEHPFVRFLKEQFPPSLLQALARYHPKGMSALQIEQNFVKELNRLIQASDFYACSALPSAEFSQATQQLVALYQQKNGFLLPAQRRKLNYRLLQEIFSNEIIRKKLVSHVSTDLQRDPKSHKPKWRKEFPIDPTTFELVKQGMIGVVHGAKGTATNIRDELPPGLIIASKTGTSEVHGKRDHAWFAGFAPADHPRYSFAIFVEHGGFGGSVAAPVAAEVLAALFE